MKLKAVLTIFVLAVLGMIFAPSASAATLLTLKEAHQNVTAAGFGSRGEALIPGTSTPAPTDQDAWHFVIPGGQDNEFVSLTATFLTPAGATVTVVSTTFQQQPNQAYLLTAPGWTLVTATAEATGGTELVLSHTRPATAVVTPPVVDCTDPANAGRDGCPALPPVVDCTDAEYAAGHPAECPVVTPPVKDCTDAEYAAAHPAECVATPPVKDCTDAEYAAGHPAECATPPSDDTDCTDPANADADECQVPTDDIDCTDPSNALNPECIVPGDCPDLANTDGCHVPPVDCTDPANADDAECIVPPVVTPPTVTPPTVTPVVTPAVTVATTTATALPHTGGSLAPLGAAILLALTGASLTVASRRATA